jgi:hypothetical protein
VPTFRIERSDPATTLCEEQAAIQKTFARKTVDRASEGSRGSCAGEARTGARPAPRTLARFLRPVGDIAPFFAVSTKVLE